MAANGVNRETIRDAFAALLNTALVGTGKPCDAVYGYLANSFGKPVSCVVVTSAGTERTQNFGDDTSDVWVYLTVWAFVLNSDGGTWTEANAEDKRDLVEKTIADVVQDNTSNSTWLKLQYAGQTRASDVQLESGITYFIEEIPVKMQIAQG